VMLFRSLLLTDPYGGVYKPKDLGRKIPHAARPLKRITVLDAEVVYPKPARRPETLTDDLLNHFLAVFKKDLRLPFPLALLENIRWTTCPTCGCEHTRAACPLCRAVVPAPPQLVQMRGNVKVTEVFRTGGVIVCATATGGALRWLVHENGRFIRENKQVVFTGTREVDMRFALERRATWVARGSRLIRFDENGAPAFHGVDCCSGQPQFQCDGDRAHWLKDGHLFAQTDLGEESLGEVLPNQTRFWLGPAFGFGFYRAMDYTVGFVFRPGIRGLNDGVKLPALPGKWVRTHCIMAAERCWFVVLRSYLGRLLTQVIVIKANGEIEASDGYEEQQNEWLAGLEGACAIKNMLLIPTDEGISRVEAVGGQIAATRTFPDTEPFVSSKAQLLLAGSELYVVEPSVILKLSLG
jgi:hypothetical protein